MTEELKEVKHKPVLVEEVLHYLDPQPHKVYVDVTLGGGGHTRAILEKEPTCKVYGLDWDKKVIETTGVKLEEEFPGRFKALWGNFSRLDLILKKAKVFSFDGILGDFGTSQIQIAQTPGLSVFNDEFLDMRMSTAHFKTTAYDLLRRCSEKDLADIFFLYGEERYSKRIAREIVERRLRKDFVKTTKQLAKLVEDVVPYNKKLKIHPATRVFQALRIVVNKELENISSFLANALKMLNVEGRLVAISFHSLEDRLVKQFFKNEQRKYLQNIEILTKKVCVATEEELEINKSARSAKLRAIKLAK